MCSPDMPGKHDQPTLLKQDLAVAHLPTLPGEITVPGTVLVRGALLDKLTKKLTGERITLGHGGGLVSLSSDTVTAVTRPIDGAFVKYREHIPDPPASFTTDRAALLALVEQATAILKAKREGNPLVAITVEPSTLMVAPLLSQRSDDVAPPELAAKTDGYPGEAIRFVFDARYLSDALAAITADTVTVHTQTPTKPAVVTEAGRRPGDDTAYRHLLMPVRVS